MITFLVGISMLAGVGLGWYGYKASLRIAAWGRGLDECDRIFQEAGEGVELISEDGRKRAPKDGARIVPFATPHLRP